MIKKGGVAGFTLIELLVVISIIALLSSVVLAALNQAKAKARDAQLLANTKTLITALELYYDEHGQYPDSYSDGYYNGGFNFFGRQIIWTTSVKGDQTDPLLKNDMQQYLPQLPSPQVRSVQWWIGYTSRLSYMLYPNTGMFGGWWPRNFAGSQCGQSQLNNKQCYVITVITEYDTVLGPAETPIRLINGIIRYSPSGPDNVFRWVGVMP